MMDAALAVQIALFQRLAHDQGLTVALGVGRVFDHTPQSQAFPYLSFAQMQVRPFSASDFEGAEHSISLEAFSDAKGRKRLLNILSAVETALQSPLSLDDHLLISLTIESIALDRAEDGRSYQASVQLKLLTEPNS
jgi:hypothetical protein